jgi:uncharacterized OB-fold protein
MSTPRESTPWTRPEPPQSDTSAPFWDATRDGRLMLQWCSSCEVAIFFPRAVCPRCLGDTLQWRQASGQGRVYAVTVEHRAQDPRMTSRVPFAIALVDLDEGVRMMSNVVGCEPDDVVVGMPVALAWERLPDGRQLPQFTPTVAAHDT